MSASGTDLFDYFACSTKKILVFFVFNTNTLLNSSQVFFMLWDLKAAVINGILLLVCAIYASRGYFI